MKKLLLFLFIALMPVAGFCVDSDVTRASMQRIIKHEHMPYSKFHVLFPDQIQYQAFMDDSHEFYYAYECGWGDIKESNTVKLGAGHVFNGRVIDHDVRYLCTSSGWVSDNSKTTKNKTEANGGAAACSLQTRSFTNTSDYDMDEYLYQDSGTWEFYASSRVRPVGSAVQVYECNGRSNAPSAACGVGAKIILNSGAGIGNQTVAEKGEFVFECTNNSKIKSDSYKWQYTKIVPRCPYVSGNTPTSEAINGRTLYFMSDYNVYCGDVYQVATQAEADNQMEYVKTATATINTRVSSGSDTVSGRVSQLVSELRGMQDQLKVTVWRDEEGKFNTARLASDSIAAVVLGTTGGLVTSHVVKKNQIKKGFEDIQCTVGGQTVAGWGDEFRVGIQ